MGQHPRHRKIISIHAPHTGGDKLGMDTGNFIYAFQSTPPIRGATRGRQGFPIYPGISIHAPHTGGDDHKDLQGSVPDDFNPRPPYGGRPCDAYRSLPGVKFQSTPPIRGATPAFQIRTNPPKISIHAPHTGGDSSCRGTDPKRADFNPRPPYGGRQGHIRGHYVDHVISIHAPHTGGDRVLLPLPRGLDYFNPRPPYGGRRCHSKKETVKL